MEKQTPEFGWSNSSPMSGEGTLDRIIEYCQYHKLFTVERNTIPDLSGDGDIVRVGPIAFHSDRHSTGNCINGWILSEQGEAFEFIYTTYWYSERYTFNKSKWVHGKWDRAVDNAIKILREAMNNHIASVERVRKEKMSRTIESFQDQKSKFESIF